jgi:GTPase
MVGDALEIDFSVYEDSDDEDDEDLPTVKRLPREVKYFDTARIHVRAGDGGTGCCAFRREKFISHGGPAGGNGGNGGSIWVVAEEGMTSLLPFRNTVHWKAKSGANGGGKDMDGANALDTYIKVPPGVIIRRKDADEDEPPLAELINSGELSHMPSAVY